MERVIEDGKRLAEEHWGYVEGLIELILKGEQKAVFSVSKEYLMELLKFQYIEAFIHGYKHGVEDFPWQEEEKRR